MFRQMLDNNRNIEMSYREDLETQFLKGVSFVNSSRAKSAKRSYLRKVNKCLTAFIESDGVISFA